MCAPAGVVIATRARRAAPAAHHRRATDAFWCGSTSLATCVAWGRRWCSLSSVLPVEEALLRLLVQHDPVPAAVLSWIVTGNWPLEPTQLRYDVTYPAEDGPQIFF